VGAYFVSLYILVFHVLLGGLKGWMVRGRDGMVLISSYIFFSKPNFRRVLATSKIVDRIAKEEGMDRSTVIRRFC